MFTLKASAIERLSLAISPPMWLVSGSKIGLGTRGGDGEYLGGVGTAGRGVGTRGGGGVFSLSLSRAPSEVTK